jgi:hypothetical protein
MINEMRKSNQKVFGMQFGDYSSILKFRTTERIDENIFKDCAKDEIDITTSEKMVSTINEKMNLFKQM